MSCRGVGMNPSLRHKNTSAELLARCTEVIDAHGGHTRY